MNSENGVNGGNKNNNDEANSCRTKLLEGDTRIEDLLQCYMRNMDMLSTCCFGK